MPKEIPKQKNNLHPRNKHQGRYDFGKLTAVLPELSNYVFVNQYHTATIDFSNPDAVKTLNKALLAYYYGVNHWDIPAGYLCPPIPGRADYVHYLADILAETNNGIIPKGKKIKCLDVGVGANAIYPIIGHCAYGWTFVGTDIDPVSVKAANAIVGFNEVLKDGIEIRLQTNKNYFFQGIIKPDEKFDLTMCNPPFYSSEADAAAQNLRKTNNLSGKKQDIPKLNFGGNSNELWCEGGELKFIISMIRESVIFSDSCRWFTSLVSKKEHLDRIYKELEKVKVSQFKTVEMAQGQKVSRLVAWSF
ncbi:23S rRNA (adenine(1618)-N(6))-methyltransferase RlmF [Lacihabitans sp. CCS-44]|uniref:23S rRNA (adenine(1618)-N(6))-methyltransferase RlmF n=1 Tax=Lacihabitans sp. CCS-44 TaxID=2487331 RepID=UPI0020CEFA0E|nr:23S rRNA (adenine(1618)-N(6))-methyltransferase RlmF [Lacihabitans sp. CCS-44]MCP9756576.1 23S rRNA (adenine(1618)-N(6))-methyltransferase RlmF [Lacihabitans sp. CCS-44]